MLERSHLLIGRLGESKKHCLHAPNDLRRHRLDVTAKTSANKVLGELAVTDHGHRFGLDGEPTDPVKPDGIPLWTNAFPQTGVEPADNVRRLRLADHRHTRATSRSGGLL